MPVNYLGSGSRAPVKKNPLSDIVYQFVSTEVGDNQLRGGFIEINIVHQISQENIDE